MRTTLYIIGAMLLLLLLSGCLSSKSQDDYTKDVIEDIFGPSDPDPTPPEPIDVSDWDSRRFACTGSSGAQLVDFFQSSDGLQGVVSTHPSTLLVATNTGRYEGRTSVELGDDGILFHFFQNGAALFDVGFSNSTCQLSGS